MADLDPDTIAAIKARAKELAAQAPPLSTAQATLLVSLFRRYPSRTQTVGN